METERPTGEGRAEEAMMNESGLEWGDVREPERLKMWGQGMEGVKGDLQVPDLIMGQGPMLRLGS